MQLFELVSPRLFRPLAGPNRAFYAELLLLLWEECRHTADYSILRAEAVSRAEDYFAALAKPRPCGAPLFPGPAAMPHKSLTMIDSMIARLWHSVNQIAEKRRKCERISPIFSLNYTHFPRICDSLKYRRTPR